MKFQSLKSLFFILTAIYIVAAAGCLKDDDFDNGSIQSVHSTGKLPKVIELKVSAADVSKFVSIAINNSTNDTTFDLVPVNLATPGVATEDLHVTVMLDSTLVNNYNNNNGTAYAVPPAALFTIVNPEVIIPKGSNTGFLQIKLKPSDFIGGDWALGFKIASVKEQGYTISGNFNTGVVAIVIKNKYDGVYNATGYFLHPVFAGNYNTSWDLITIGANSNAFQLKTTTIFSVIVNLTVNPETNLVSIESSSVSLDPYDPAKNYYTPEDRTYHLDFGYSGGTRHLTGTATYWGPR